jgi:hypothetical protein
VSDVMLHGILNMPPGIWDNSDIHKAQRHDAYKQASKRIENLEAKIDELMLEYCPAEMTQAQLDKWVNSQKVVKPIGVSND